MTLSIRAFELSDKLIMRHVYSRLDILKGKDKRAIESEFKEWIQKGFNDQKETWSIPDLTNKPLRKFFLRAIAQIH